MKVNIAHGSERQRAIASLLHRGRKVSTSKLAQRFSVSAMTIRRDLKELERSGLIIPCYGGAIPARRITFEFEFDQQRQRNKVRKERIGRSAAGMVSDGQCVLLDTGTTTLEIARALAKRKVRCTAVTSSLVIASELWGHSLIDLMMLGGRVRGQSPDLVGPATEMMLENMTADIAFLGSDGIDAERGCFAGDMETARVAGKMASCSRKVVVVADSSKLGEAGSARYLKIDEIDELITDVSASRAIVKDIRERGVAVTLV